MIFGGTPILGHPHLFIFLLVDPFFINHGGFDVFKHTRAVWLSLSAALEINSFIGAGVPKSREING